MPTYEYACPTNGEVVEVRHGMTETVKTWGQLCERAEKDPGNTPKNATVERKISGGMVIRKDLSGGPQPPPAMGGGGCGARCGCHP